MKAKPARHQLILFSLAIITILIRSLASYFPYYVESFYSNGIFLVVRWLIDNTLSYFPIPLIIVFFIIVIGLAIKGYFSFKKSNKSLKEKVLHSTYSFLSFIALIIILFFWLWGFNYARLPIETHMGFEPRALSVLEIKSALEKLSPILLAARANIKNAPNAQIDESFVPKDFKQIIVKAVKKTLNENDYKVLSTVKPRILKPKGILRKFGASGIYWPFVGESNIDAALHPLQWPEVLAHEVSHAYGFGDEGTCSFIAYIALKDCKEPFIKYGALLEYWRTLASNYLRYYPKEYAAYRKSLPEDLQADLNAINERSRKYQDFFPGLRRASYNAYLKTQGISEGLENYNRVLMLVEAWEKVN